MADDVLFLRLIWDSVEVRERSHSFCEETENTSNHVTHVCPKSHPYTTSKPASSPRSTRATVRSLQGSLAAAAIRRSPTPIHESPSSRSLGAFQGTSHTNQPLHTYFTKQ